MKYPPSDSHQRLTRWVLYIFKKWVMNALLFFFTQIHVLMEKLPPHFVITFTKRSWRVKLNRLCAVFCFSYRALTSPAGGGCPSVTTSTALTGLTTQMSPSREDYWGELFNLPFSSSSFPHFLPLTHPHLHTPTPHVMAGESAWRGRGPVVFK